MTVSSVDTLPVLDFRALTDAQMTTAEAIFNEFRDKDLKPAYLADADANRALLDLRVICDLLGFNEDTYQGVRRLAAKWCAEPSVHGGKGRPGDAQVCKLGARRPRHSCEGRNPRVGVWHPATVSGNG